MIHVGRMYRKFTGLVKHENATPLELPGLKSHDVHKSDAPFHDSIFDALYLFEPSYVQAIVVIAIPRRRTSHHGIQPRPRQSLSMAAVELVQPKDSSRPPTTLCHI